MFELHPIKISNRLIIDGFNNKAAISLGYALGSENIIHMVNEWLVENKNHPRSADCREWLDKFQEQLDEFNMKKAAAAAQAQPTRTEPPATTKRNGLSFLLRVLLFGLFSYMVSRCRNQ